MKPGDLEVLVVGNPAPGWGGRYFHGRLIRHAIEWDEGFVLAPTAPGLGIELDEDLARAHPYEWTGLRLEMQEAPCDYANGNAFLGGAPATGD